MANNYPYLYLSSSGTILAECPPRVGRPPRGIETREIDGKPFFVIRNCLPYDGVSNYDEKTYVVLQTNDASILVPRKDRNSSNPAGGVYNDVLNGNMTKQIYEKSRNTAESFANPKTSIGYNLASLKELAYA